MQNSTNLHRQVHPKFIQDNKISSQIFEVDPRPIENIFSSVFTPNTNDEGKLSVYNGDKFSAQDSFEHYTESLQSAGVVTVTVEECSGINLTVSEDNLPFDGHSNIDFGVLSKKEVKIKAQQLKAAAIKRDWTYKK